MVKVIHESRPKARKDYTCDACLFLRDALGDIVSTLSFAEKREVVKARKAGWKVLKGETYLHQFNTDGGDTWTFRARPGIADICSDHDLYPEI